MTQILPCRVIVRLIPIVFVATALSACGSTNCCQDIPQLDGNIFGDTLVQDAADVDAATEDLQHIDTIEGDQTDTDNVDVEDSGTDAGADDATQDSDDTTEPVYSGPCRITRRIDPECTGKPESCVITETDDAGNQLLEKSDFNCDFKPPFTDCVIRTFDVNGRVLTYGQSPICARTPNTACATFTYDEFGRKTTETLDEYCGGIPNECYTYTYDDSGNLTTKRTDIGCAGTHLECLRQTFDGKDRMTESRLDLGCDNDDSNDFNCTTFTYDDGRPATRTSDGNCDLVPERCYSYDYTFDVEQGSVITEEANDCAGSNRVCKTSMYERGMQYLTEYKVDTGCDGTPDRDCLTNHYDANGNKTEERVDSNCDGTPEYCFNRVYSGDGNLITEMKTPGCAGAPQDCSTWSFEGNCAATLESAVEVNGIIECGNPTDGNTATMGHAVLSEYNCIGWTPTADETIYSYTAPIEGCDTRWKVTANIRNLETDLDMFLLTELKPDACIDKSTNSGTTSEQIIFEALPGNDYYLAVDGYAGASGPYTIEITCECAEVPAPSCDGRIVK